MDEKSIIAMLTSALKLEHDDVSFIRFDGKLLVLKCDMLVRSTDAPKEMKLWQISRKSVVATLSDMVCKGVKPIAVLISLAVPNLTRKEVRELAKGFYIAEKEFGIKIVGGDTNAADDLIIDCIMAGFADKIIKRSNAKNGDVIITTGLFGYTSIGLKILLEGAESKGSLKKKALNAILLPKPRVEFLNIINYVNSSMDSSDGLASTLNELSTASNKQFIIDNKPASSEVYEFASINNYEPEELIFDGGEEYEIVATLPKEHVDEVRRLMPVHIIGEVREGKGVYVRDDSKYKRLRRKGFIHLSNK